MVFSFVRVDFLSLFIIFLGPCVKDDGGLVYSDRERENTS